MQYCTRCLYPENHPLGITFNSFGVCSGCTVHEENIKLIFQKKPKSLKDLLVTIEIITISTTIV